MKGTELKKEISKRYNIPTNHLKVRNDHGWIFVYIKEDEIKTQKLEDYDTQRKFKKELESFISNKTTVYTYIADDGYDSENNCIMIEFNDFKYL